ncbi:hypothetical protein ES319_D03G140900v1 [Gossypium barbadense]|uniref:RING-type domain-containing protein n=1 Tax=Gossypium barbadense TaxID=3634 RepID=A0A5J5S5I4_GOSBA|nr:hypothetical protein ES319_D03G140900v1 [Gossypium barbadense]KAB2038378.1 hypothetical protein ES319_D03G140900v1 [Gossypium barbadense]KAB2038379.1 hypothetical protein ES319_D03G140900v1 [Gossypium barbadense]
MGFDNECILNIQSLAGEYFCPVCRLLVCPNEALQSQCTHLYCKPCLTYVVSTTRACPYDGYLVTEADSMPLVESNQALAETIGKITVHCLYHRSGCTWQGPLSECTAHCSGCVFGNSPVVCNRCGVQIVHRQVQEHAQNCPMVQPQAQKAEGGQEISASGTAAAADHTQVASQAQASQTTTSNTPVQDLNQQANPNPQSHAISQVAMVTSEQWSQQQQQQFQQYYQHYSGYDPYDQQYYPYQQQALPQQQPLQVNAKQMTGHNPVYLQTQPLPQPEVQSQPQAQPHSHLPGQVPVAAQPQNQAQTNEQQQPQLTMPPHSQIPAQTYPTTQGHSQPQVQPLPQAHPHQQYGHIPQYQQLHSQMQLPQPQLHPASQAQPQAQQLQPLPPPQPQLQRHPQPSQPLNPNLLTQTQHPAAQAVSGHQSYSQSQPHQQMQLVTLQNPLHMPAQGGLHPQQHPAEKQNSYPQQPPQIRPPQSHAPIPNQQQPGLLPLPGPMLQQAHHHSLQHPHSVQPQSVMQPPGSIMPQQYMEQQPLSIQPMGLVQPQMHQQNPFVQQQQSLQSQLLPPGPPWSFQQPLHAYPQPQQNVAGLHAVQPYQRPNLAGRPLTPNHGLQSQPYPLSAPGMLVKPLQLGVNQLSSYQNNMLGTNNQSGLTLQPMSEVPGDHGTLNVVEQEADLSSQGIAKKEANVLDVASSLGANMVNPNTSKYNADLKSIDEKPAGDVGDNTSGFDISTKLIQESRWTDLVLNRDTLSKNMAKGEAIEDQKDVVNGEHKVEEKANLGEEQNGKMLKERNKSQDEGTAKGPAGNELTGIPPCSQVQPGSFLQPSHSVPVVDQGILQPLQLPYGSNSNQQKPAASATLQAHPPGLPSYAQAPGLPPNQVRPQASGQTSVPPENFASSFGRGPSSYGPQGPYNQGPASGAPRMPRSETLVCPAFGTPSYGPEAHLVQQRSASMLDYHADSERLKPRQDEHLNPYPLDHVHPAGDRGQFDEDLKLFSRPSQLDTEPVPKYGSYFSSSRPLDRGPHGFAKDMGPWAHEKETRGLSFDPMIGSGHPRFFPPYHPDDAGERSVGLPEDTLGRPEFLGTVPGYGRRCMDGFVSRSPGREYSGVSSHRFEGYPGDEIDGKECRFNGFPGHIHRGGFESSGHMAEHFGPDIRPPHFRRGEHFGRNNLPGQLQMEGPIGFGDFSSHEQMGEFDGPGNFRQPRLGEPGFRSSYSLPEFPNDGGIYTGGMDSFEILRTRKPLSMGWCRICKVDCETVEGLDLHSQTGEHQKTAMDMVAIIKQNAKKQKQTSSDHSLHNDSNKSKNAKFESRSNNIKS